jgi:hypothetical protein
VTEGRNENVKIGKCENMKMGPSEVERSKGDWEKGKWGDGEMGRVVFTENAGSQIAFYLPLRNSPEVSGQVVLLCETLCNNKSASQKLLNRF